MPKQREHRRTWTTQEDNILKEAIYSVDSSPTNKISWKLVSDLLAQNSKNTLIRNPKQCRERWVNCLDPNRNVNNIIWGKQQDIQLIQACKKYGRHWSKLVSYYDRKYTDNFLKNHFHSALRRIVRHFNRVISSEKQTYTLSKKQGVKMNQREVKIIEEIIKVRQFDIKLISKVFSLIDNKLEGKYQPKCTLDINLLQNTNQAILQYMKQYMTEENEPNNVETLQLIHNIININKFIKTKYGRETKLSLQQESLVARQLVQRRKIEKKINQIVMKQVGGKVVPNRKNKYEILTKIEIKDEQIKQYIRRNQQKQQKRYQIVCPKQQNQEQVQSCFRYQQIQKNKLNLEELQHQKKSLQFSIRNPQFFQQSRRYDQFLDLPNNQSILLQNSVGLYLQQRSRNMFQSQEIINTSTQLKPDIKDNRLSKSSNSTFNEQIKPFTSNFLNCIKMVDSTNNKKIQTNNKSTETQGYFDFQRFSQTQENIFEKNLPFKMQSHKNIFLKPIEDSVINTIEFHNHQPQQSNNSIQQLFKSSLQISREIGRSSQFFGNKFFDSRDFQFIKLKKESQQFDNDCLGIKKT